MAPLFYEMIFFTKNGVEKPTKTKTYRFAECTCFRRQGFMKLNLQEIALQTCTSLRLAPTFCQT